jgi:hypothetical protein
MAGEADTPGASGAETIFTAALALPREKRLEYVQTACGDDDRLRRRVEALLRAHDGPEGFLPEKPGAVK